MLSATRRWRRFLKDRAHLDRRPTGDGSLAPPRQCVLQISGFQHPKTAYVLLGLQVRPVGDEHPTIGLRPQRPCVAAGGETTNENPDPGGYIDVVRGVAKSTKRGEFFYYWPRLSPCGVAELLLDLLL